MKSRYLILVVVCAGLLLAASGMTTLASTHDGGAEGSWTPLPGVHVDVAQAPTPTPTQTASLPGVRMDLARAPTPTPTQTAPASACVSDAAYVADVTIPDNSRLASSEAFTKTWRVKNTGTCTWGPNYKLVYVDREQMNGPREQAFAHTVLPGQEALIDLPLVAPTYPGTHTGVWQMADVQGVAFGQILTVVLMIPDAGGSNPGPQLLGPGSSRQSRQTNGQGARGVGVAPLPTLAERDTDYIDDSIDINVKVPTPTPTATPDKTQKQPPDPVKAGGRFTKKWTLLNSGMFDWGSGYAWSFVGGDQMGAPDAVKIPATAAGARFEVEVPMIAPAEPGIYEGAWQMRDPDGRLFGKLGLARVKVNEVGMNEPAQIGNWIIRAVRVDRDKEVWLRKVKYEAEGVFALIRLQVTYVGEGSGWMDVDLDISAHDEEGYAFSYNEDVGDAARWMVADQAALDFGFAPGTKDYPAMVTFPVPAESKELWLDISLKEEAINSIRKKNPDLRIEDIPQQASFYMQATLSKSAQTYTGTFIDAPAMDETAHPDLPDKGS